MAEEPEEPRRPDDLVQIGAVRDELQTMLQLMEAIASELDAVRSDLANIRADKIRRFRGSVGGARLYGDRLKPAL
jgi:hypothetical protein